jgi:hypothetical protein
MPVVVGALGASAGSAAADDPPATPTPIPAAATDVIPTPTPTPTPEPIPGIVTGTVIYVTTITTTTTIVSAPITVIAAPITSTVNNTTTTNSSTSSTSANNGNTSGGGTVGGGAGAGKAAPAPERLVINLTGCRAPGRSSLTARRDPVRRAKVRLAPTASLVVRVNGRRVTTITLPSLRRVALRLRLSRSGTLTIRRPSGRVLSVQGCTPA